MRQRLFWTIVLKILIEQLDVFVVYTEMMFKGERILAIIIILGIIVGGVYFTVSKFKENTTNIAVSPSPSSSPLSFLDPSSSASPQQLPLEKVKKLSNFPGVLPSKDLQNKKSIIQTNKGIIELEIYPEASMAASNFIILSSNGFYNNLTFHRVEDWVIQGGDPLGTGMGGPGYQFKDEPVTRPYIRGVVAMANSGPDTNGSQFFILTKDYPLQPDYTIFGQVIKGLEVVDKIRVGDTMQKVTVQNLK